MNKVTEFLCIVASLIVVASYTAQAEEIIYDAPDENATDALLDNPTNKSKELGTPAPSGNESQASAPQEQAPQEQAPPAQPPQMSQEDVVKRFTELEAEIAAGTTNLDIYFEYAQVGVALGKAKEATQAYKHMLSVDPGLFRVKLELALLYTRMGKFKAAKTLFEEVLASNPPEAVQQNIGQVMVVVNNGLKPNVFNGSVTTGYNLDSNANSAASSGQTTFIDNSLQLGESSLAQRDSHFYGSASLGHTRKFDIDSDYYAISYETTGSIYKTYQDTEHSLDIGLASIKTGPVLNLPELKTKLGLNGTMSILDLNGNRYLKTRSWESSVNYTLRDNILLNGAYSYEYRKFINTLTATTYTDRSGNANQQTLGITYGLTPVDIFNATTTWRHENAFSQTYGNTQLSTTGSYIRVLPWDLSFITLLGFKKTNYHKPDALVSAATLRHDRERSMTYTLSKKLPYNITTSVAYQYKNVTSNIQNNDFHNNRYSLTLGWSF